MRSAAMVILDLIMLNKKRDISPLALSGRLRLTQPVACCCTNAHFRTEYQDQELRRCKVDFYVDNIIRI